MQASESNFNFINNESMIKILFFQRAYTWKEEQWELLLENLKYSYENKSEHFLGSIMPRQLPTNTREGSQRNLIDGQQRLTTFSILIKALYDRLENDDKQDYNGYFFTKPIKNKTPKIQHSKVDREYFNQILEAENFESLKDLELESHNKKDKRIKNRLLRCYEFFTNKSKDIPNCKEFLDFILNSKLWVTINLNSNEDEQKIFDSINTAGIPLSTYDIIKNAIFDKAMKLEIPNKLYEKYWENVFESEKTIDFWNQKVGKEQKYKSEIFLHAFAVVEEFFDYSQKHTIAYIASLYKKHIEDFSNDELEDFIKRIYDFATLYRKFPEITQDTLFNYNNWESRLFHTISYYPLCRYYSS